MTKMIKHKVSLDSAQSGPAVDLRLPSGASKRFSGYAPTHELELTEQECAQLETEGYKVTPGSSAYRAAAKPKPKKKGGGAVKDIAEPRKQEDE